MNGDYDSSALQMGRRQTTDERLQTRKKLLLESGCKEIIIMRLSVTCKLFSCSIK